MNIPMVYLLRIIHMDSFIIYFVSLFKSMMNFEFINNNLYTRKQEIIYQTV